MRDSRKTTTPRSKAARLIRTMLNRIRKLCCDRTGACTRIQYVDRVFRDLYGIKSFARRSASCKTMSQVVQVFNEIGIKELWLLLSDDTYYEVMTLLVDVQERKDQLKKVIKKAQKKLASTGGTLRVDQKSKNNKRINKSQDEMKWLNKRYRDAIEGLQDNLNIRSSDVDDYKDRFAALKNFADRGTIGNVSWDMEEDPYNFDFEEFRPRRQRPFNVDDYDMDNLDFGEDDSGNEYDERFENIEKSINTLAQMIMNQNRQNPQSNPMYANPPQAAQKIQVSPGEEKILQMIQALGRKVGDLEDRIDDFDGEDEYEDQTPNLRPGRPYYGQAPQEPYTGPQFDDIAGMMNGVPYTPNDPKIAGVPTTAEILQRTREQEAAREQTPKEETPHPTNPGNPINAYNREEVNRAPTDYQRLQSEETQSGESPGPVTQ